MNIALGSLSLLYSTLLCNLCFSPSSPLLDNIDAADDDTRRPLALLAAPPPVAPFSTILLLHDPPSQPPRPPLLIFSLYHLLSPARFLVQP